ncbi:hypothetical protein [Shewanella aestuarii]|uniref:DUF805 domain-containing protein n=1 Tax=Shewanella aestuarii TaxID=1028752 RepID=A0A6G9QFR9_9GAMM|nr:hypothetical protein [Shewanella aestuarii]QIR13316.1 hypothetical protein HBH39_01445 [Shewanella aestuarii]
MQFNTLWCLQGRDNPLRFLIVMLVSLLLLSLVTLVFPQSVLILMIGVVLILVQSASTMRRLRDAAKSKRLMLMVMVPSFLLVLSCYFAPIGVIAGLSLLTLASSVYVGLFASDNKKRNYIEGYNGPASYEKVELGNVRRRQEPQVFGEHNQQVTTGIDASSHDAYSETQAIFASAPKQDKTATDTGELDGLQAEPMTKSSLKQSFQQFERFDVDQDDLASGSVTELVKSWVNSAKTHEKSILFGAKVAGVFVISALIVWAMVSFSQLNSDDEPSSASVKSNEHSIANQRVSVKLPDGFWVVMQNKILTVRWLGEDADAKRLWQLATAEGDQTCSELVFNDGSRYRPISVELMNDGGTEATFSPLDNKSIINHIAMRGSFKLCGYDFSLKGSQATLMQHHVFSDYLVQ